MHEASLVRSLLQQAAALAAEHEAAQIEEIRVELGPLSGVEPLLVRSAFERLTAECGLAGARLRIDEVPLTARCRACKTDFIISDFQFRCSDCGSGGVDVTGGDAMRLVDITICDVAEKAAL